MNNRLRPLGHFQRMSTALITTCLLGMLISCGGGSSSPPTMFAATSLVSDGVLIPASQSDINLKNPWGIAFNPNAFVWVANNQSSTLTLYDGDGVPQPLTVTIPSGAAAPTGIVFNPTSGFPISQNNVTGTAAFIFVGETGTVSAWSPTVNRTNAVIAATGPNGAVYKGLALAANRLYAADFRNRHIDMYDAGFNLVAAPGAFVDPLLPADYAPFNVAANNGQIYVSYAQFTPPNTDENPGAGLGIVSVYDTAGTFIKRLITGGKLNAPWGMAFAPSSFPGFPSALLVGNFGDGKINAYDPDTGRWRGALMSDQNTALSIDGLWGIAFGNGLPNQPTSTLFFAAGPNNEANGVYGRIDAMPSP
jgi:uncharacterized protein (TIGR03118 family)